MKIAILAICIVFGTVSAMATEISVHQRISQSNNKPVVVGEASAEKTVEILPKTGSFKDVNPKAYISLGVDHDYPYFMGDDMHIRVVVNVTPYDVNNTAQTAFNQSLEIDFFPNSPIRYQDLDQYIFSDAYKLDIRLDSVFINGVSDTILPLNIFIDGDISVDRTYPFEDYVNTVITPDDSTILMDCDTIPDDLEIRWSTIIGADEYQLEWTYINDYTKDSGSYSSTGLTYDFKFNSTRISTPETYYRLPLIFDHGYILYRVRAVGKDTADLSKRLFGVWSYASSGNVTDGAVLKYHNEYPHEYRKNWQLTTTFAEEGKKKEVISYYDGSLRNRQSVTRINTDNNTIVGETVYDYQGRPAVNILPVPVQTPSCDSSAIEDVSALRYYPNFNLSDSLDAYSRDDFDLDDTSGCATIAAPLNDSTGTSNYYSPSNPNKTDHQAYVPDAAGYPYTQIEYTPDNTGRIRRQGGVGQEFQLGSGRETKYFYGKPQQIQLNRLFGSEVGYASHYKKNLVIDPNGQISVSYLDQEGRVVATALAGEVPDNLEALTSADSAEVILDSDLFETDANGVSLANAVGTDGRSIRFNQEILVSTEGNYTFIYDAESDTLYDECLADDVCIHCIYDLKFMLTDACGDTLPTSSVVTDTTLGYFTVNDGDVSFHTTCQSPSGMSYADTIEVSLTPGNYTVTKVLSLREDAIDHYISVFLDSNYNDCVKTLYDFQSDALALLDTSSCDISCDSCVAQLGTKDDFVSHGYGTALEYDILLEDCQAPCAEYNPCLSAYEMMLIDMSPGGQYGQYLNSQGGNAASSFPLSIYKTGNYLPGASASWKNPHLIKNSVVYPYYADVNGDSARVSLQSDGSGGFIPAVDNASYVHIDANGHYYTYPDNLSSVYDFIDLFQPEWAEALIYYHPEYAYYLNCLNTLVEDTNGVSVQSFDNLLQSCNTFSEAVSAGIIKSNHSSISNPEDRLEDIFTLSGSHAYDPFVSSGNYGAFGTALESKFDNYFTINTTDYSMIEAAAISARCALITGNGGITTGCNEFGEDISGYTTSQNDSIRDLEWSILKSMYVGEKLIQKQAFNHDESFTSDFYNGCFGQSPFDPSKNGFFLSGEAFDSDQPCYWATAWRYMDKEKRFPDYDDIPGFDPNASVSQLYADAAYDIYMNTGVCPSAHNFQTLLNNLASNDLLDSTNLLLGGLHEWHGLYYSLNELIPTVPQVYWDTISTDSTLDIAILDSISSDTICKLGLNGYDFIDDWSDVTSFSNISPIDFDGYYYNFNIVIGYDSSGYALFDTIRGYTCMNIMDCQFDIPCSANQIAQDVQILMSQLSRDGDLRSTNVSYGADSDYNYLESDPINNLLSATHVSNRWGHNSGTDVYEIRTVGDTLCLEVTDTDPSSFSAFSDIEYFKNIQSATQHYFTIEAYDTTHALIATFEMKAYMKSSGDTIPVSMGDCTPSCDDLSNQLAQDLWRILDDEFDTASYSANINMFNSPYLTDVLLNALPSGVNTTSGSESTYEVDSLYYDSLTIAATQFAEGEGTDTLCMMYFNISSDTSYSLSFDMITELGEIQTTGQPNGNAYYDFYMLTEFYHPDSMMHYSDTLWGSTGCLAINSCDICDTVIAPSDTIIFPEEDANLMSISNSSECESIYGQYKSIIGTYNTYVSDSSLNWPLADTLLFSEITHLNQCNCVGRYAKYLESLTDGIGREPDSASIAGTLEIGFHCPIAPCTPYVPIIDTLENIYVPYVNPCIEDLLNTAMFNAQLGYDHYLDSMTTVATNLYLDHCLGAEENLTMNYPDAEYHFTLYYYDQAGNLIKTVPPEGVQVLDDISADSDSLSTLISHDRLHGTKSVFTSHQLATNYIYNSLNQLVRQNLPDHDKMDVYEYTLTDGLDDGLNITSVQFVTSSRGYLSGYKIVNSDTLGLAYKSDDGGKTWQRLHNLVGADLNKVNASNGSAYAVGDDGVILVSNDDGMTWLSMNTTGHNITANLNDVALTSAQSGLIVGEEGTIISIQGGGLSVVSPTVTNANYPINSDDEITAVKQFGERYYISVWHTPVSGSPFGLLYKSTDSTGLDWTPMISVQAPHFADVSYIDNDNAFACGEGGRIYQTIDGGDNWYVLDSEMEEDLNKIFFMDVTNGITLADSSGYGILYATYNGGINWTRLDTDGTYFNNLYPYYNDASTYGAKLALVGSDGSVARLIMQNNTGFGIIPINSPNVAVDLKGVWAYGEGPHKFLFVAGDNSTIYYTRNAYDSYVTWESYNTGVGGLDVTEIRGDSLNTVLNGTMLDASGKLYSFTLNAQAAPPTEIVSWSAVTTPSSGNQEFTSLTDDELNGRILAYNKNDEKLYSLEPVSASPVTTATDLGVVTSSLALADEYTAIDAASSGDVLLISATGYATQGAEAAGSYTWTETKDNIRPLRLNDLDMVETNHLWLVGDATTILRIDTNTTSVEMLDKHSNDNWNAIYSYSSLKSVVVGDSGVITKISGTAANPSFEDLSSGTNEDFYDVTVSGNRAYFVGKGSNTRKVIGNINNSSATIFTMTGTAGNTINGVCINASGTNLFVGEHSRTYLGGLQSIVPNKQVFTHGLNKLHFADANNGYVIGDHHTIRYTANGGNTWSVVEPENGYATVEDINSVHTISGASAVIVGEDNYISIADGTNTSTSGITLPGGYDSGIDFNDIVFVDSDTAYIVGGNTNGQALRSYDAGTTWSAVSGSVTGVLHTVHGFTRNNTFIAGGASGQVAYYDGSTLTTAGFQPTGFSTTINDIYFHDDFNGFLVGDDGEIHKSINGALNSAGKLSSLNWTEKGTSDGGLLSQTTETDKDIKAIGFSERYNGFIGGTYASGSPDVYARLLHDESELFSTFFYYDKLGRIVVSQNSKQYNLSPKRYSYTMYDELGRVVEAGEKDENTTDTTFTGIFGDWVSSHYDPNVINDTSLVIWIEDTTGDRREVTHSYYDYALEVLEDTLPAGFTQNNLRKRIATVMYEDLYDGDTTTYDHATHYAYDIHGNVNTLIQDNPQVGYRAQRFKRFDYSYDLISGNVHKVSYQKDSVDAWYHKYDYDGDNRLVHAYTSADNHNWDMDAKYIYYDHGPLARVELGQHNVQGMDYAYTLQGWLKGVNSDKLNPLNDMGHDGNLLDTSNANALFATDAMGYSLTYYDGDYSPIDTTLSQDTARFFLAAKSGSDVMNYRGDLYNGNIGSMVTTIAFQDSVNHLSTLKYDARSQATGYKYDQLNRLTDAQAYNNYCSGSNVWASNHAYRGLYKNSFTYDANGNILTQQRRDYQLKLIDSLTYNYAKNGSNQLVQNRLYSVNDGIADAEFSDDIDDMGTFEDDLDYINDSSNNYRYDDIGQLIQDEQEEIDTILWRVDGKIAAIYRTAGSDKKCLVFDYDAMGNRIAKHQYSTDAASPEPDAWEKTTYYTRDAQGNVMGTYAYGVDSLLNTTSYALTERNIYGSSRVGINKEKIELIGVNPDNTEAYHNIGDKSFELSNHLGNVLAVVSDKKYKTYQLNILDHFTSGGDSTEFNTWEAVGSATFDMDNDYLEVTATANNEGVKRLLKTQKGKAYEINMVGTLLSSSDRFIIKLYDIVSGDTIHAVKHNGTADGNAFVRQFIALSDSTEILLLSKSGAISFEVDDLYIRRRNVNDFRYMYHDFESDFDIHKWTYGGTNVLTLDTGWLKVDVDNQYEAIGRWFTTIPGHSYDIDFNIDMGTTNVVHMVIEDWTTEPHSAYSTTGYTTDGVKSKSFTATGHTTRIRFHKYGQHGTPTYYHLDNVEIRDDNYYPGCGGVYASEFQLQSDTIQWDTIDVAIRSIVNGQLNVSTSGVDQGIKKTVVIDRLKPHKIWFDYGSSTSGTVRMDIYDAYDNTYLARSNYSNGISKRPMLLYPDADSIRIEFVSTSGGSNTWSIDNFDIVQEDFMPLISDFESNPKSYRDFTQWGGDTSKIDLSIENGRLKAELESTSASVNRVFWHRPGHTYRASFDLDTGTTDGITFKIVGYPVDLSSTDVMHNQTYTTNGSIEVDFTPTGSDSRLIQFLVYKTNNGSTLQHYYMDNVIIEDITDTLFSPDANDIVASTHPVLQSSADYSPFGVMLSGRNFSLSETSVESIKADLMWDLENADLTEDNGTGYDITAYGGALDTLDRCGNSKGAIYLDGTDDYLEVTDGTLLTPGADDFSVSIWVKKLTATVSFAGNIALSKWKNNAHNASEWELTLSDGPSGYAPGSFKIQNGSTQYKVSSDAPIDLNKWYHIVGVRDGEYIKYYVNGELKGSTYVGTVSVNDAGLNMIVGARSGKYSNMEIDDIMYFTRALSASEIANMYSNTSCDFDSKSIAYRYAFQGQERDDEVKGAGNSYDFGARMYDSRLGRWLSIDPLFKKYPGLSTYNYAGNSPIMNGDSDGREIIIKFILRDNKTGEYLLSEGQIQYKYYKYNPEDPPWDGQHTYDMSYIMDFHKAYKENMKTPIGQDHWNNEKIQSDDYILLIEETEYDVRYPEKTMSQFDPARPNQKYRGKENTNNDAEFIGVLKWDRKLILVGTRDIPNSGFPPLKEKMGYMSSSSVLFHEVGHVVDLLDIGYIQFQQNDLDLGGTPQTEIDNLVKEQNYLKQINKATNRGEYVRDTYSGEVERCITCEVNEIPQDLKEKEDDK